MLRNLLVPLEMGGGLVGCFVVVPPNEAHVRIMNGKQETFQNGGKYWRIPFITKVQALPLENITVEVPELELNDNQFAKFNCEVMCFLRISDVQKAARFLPSSNATGKLGFDIAQLSKDLRAIIQSVARTSAAKQSIKEIYANREILNESIKRDIREVLPQWGLELVNLELIDITDAEKSTIIQDIQRQRAAEIKRDADIRVAETARASRVAQAEAEETAKKREIEKDRNIQLTQIEQEKIVGIQKQDALQEIALRETEANAKKVEARRKIEVGTAEIEKQKTEQIAMASRIQVEQAAEAERNRVVVTADAEAKRTVTLATAQKNKLELEAEGRKAQLVKEGEGTAAQTSLTGNAAAEVVRNTGVAEGDAIRAKKLADAEGTLRNAEALKQYNEAGLSIEVIKANKEIQIERWRAFAQSLQKADMKFIMPGDKAPSFFGVEMNASTGANFKLLADELGVDINKVVDNVKNVGKDKDKK